MLSFPVFRLIHRSTDASIDRNGSPTTGLCPLSRADAEAATSDRKNKIHVTSQQNISTQYSDKTVPLVSGAKMSNKLRFNRPMIYSSTMIVLFYYGFCLARLLGPDALHFIVQSQWKVLPLHPSMSGLGESCCSTLRDKSRILSRILKLAFCPKYSNLTVFTIVG